MPYRKVLCPCSVSATLWHAVAGSLPQCWVCNGDNYGMELETPALVVLLAGKVAAVCVMGGIGSRRSPLTPLLAFLSPTVLRRDLRTCVGT